MSLTADFNFTDYADQVTRFTTARLSTAVTESTVAGWLHLLTTSAERDLLRFGDSEAFSRIACAPGCSACCVVNISVLVPEAITIVKFLKKSLDEESLSNLRERLQELYVKTRWLDDEERLYLRTTCAFLDNEGKCMIHVVRPLLCRSITSLDGKSCREAVVAAPLGGQPMVMMNLFQKEFFEAVYQGLAQGLNDLGLDDRPWQLTAAIHTLLQDLSTANRYLAGEPVVSQ